jgi:hypothetical protein
MKTICILCYYFLPDNFKNNLSCNQRWRRKRRQGIFHHCCGGEKEVEDNNLT